MKRIVRLLPVLGAVLAGQLHATVLTVPSAGYPTVTAALAACTNGDTIRVSAGTYSTNSGEVFPLVIDIPITLEALYATNPPTLQADGLHTVVLVESPGVTVRGLRITGGLGSEGIYGMDGGGICIFVGEDASGSVLITDCIIEGNTCPFDETYNGCGGGIYCGGTWCTCFEIGITNCTVRANGIPVSTTGLFGNGGGVFCGMLSKVWIENCTLEGNSANDRGAGAFVDGYALVMLKNSRVRDNVSPGDPTRAGWGGKGGGVFIDGEAVCSVAGCDITGNSALYYGGGLFTMSGVVGASTGGICTNSGGHFFTMATLSNLVSSSLIASNNAGSSGGGAYIRDHAYLAIRTTTNYWNNATSDGAGVYVAGGAGGGGKVEFADQCLLEGNECAGRGAGVFLGTNGIGTFRDTRFLGNASGGDGGAAFLDGAASATLANCLVTYNNAARGYGGGFRLASTASAQLQHCSVVGNFAPWACSAFYLDNTSRLSITNSILWRNAGGSVQTNGGTLQIAYSLNEDGPAPLTGSPRYVGWGTNTSIYVDLTSPYPGAGTSGNPYNNLQVALDKFDFRLAASSPCLGAASDGGNIGASTGSGTAAGNIVASLRLGSGTYDIRGRNIIFTRGLQGNGSANSTIWNAVFGYIEDTYLRDFAITGERWFGGLVLRGAAAMDRCRIYSNTALKDGGGVYICQSNVVNLGNCMIDSNSAGWNGGGLFINSNTWVAFTTNLIQLNSCSSQGGGIYSQGSNYVYGSVISQNSSTSVGGGLRLEGGVTWLEASQVITNTAWRNNGGGIHVSGTLTVTNSAFAGNRTREWDYQGGAMCVASTGDVLVQRSQFVANTTDGYYSCGGAIYCGGKTRIFDCGFTNNQSGEGGALGCASQTWPYCEDCDFIANTGWYVGGAVVVWDAPMFLNCRFLQNSSTWGGAAHCSNPSRPTFDRCEFFTNSANYGGSVDTWNSASLFLECGFRNNTASIAGGAISLRGADQTRLVDCAIVGSQAAQTGGGVNVQDSARPSLVNVMVMDNRVTNPTAGSGGGLACHDSTVARFEGLLVSNCVAVLGGGAYGNGTSSSTFERCRLCNNRAQSTVVSADGGGGYFTESATSQLTHCLFQGNSADNDGAGFIALGTAAVTVTNTWLEGNQATNTGGGAKLTAGSSGIFQNCTLVGNSAITNGGGGILLDSQATVVLDSVIIYSNRFDGIAGAGSSLAVHWSCVQPPWLGGWSGIGNTNVNPLLDSSGFFLTDGSPCIDAGNLSPALNDAALPPGKGSVRNDMGATGGALNSWTPATVSALWISPGGVWRYYDLGQQPPGNWQTNNYDDSTWTAGVARFGWGGKGEVTTVRSSISTYFRRTFMVSNISAYTNLELHLLRDDGAIVYVNGMEAFRANMPGGAAVYSTLASSCVTGPAEYRWFTNALNPALLVTGTNVIAVELHQCQPGDSDAGFDLSLASSPAPAVASPAVLRHHYAFNETTGTVVHDVAGGPAWDATIGGTNTAWYWTNTASGGQLYTPPGWNQSDDGTCSGNYIDLPDGIITSMTNYGSDITIEMWVNWTDMNRPGWQRLFEIGSTTGGTNRLGGRARTFLSEVCRGDTGGCDMDMYGAGSDFELHGPPIPNNQQTLVTLAYDVAHGQCAIYTNGSLCASLRQALAGLGSLSPDYNCWLGRAFYSGHPMFNGLWNDFRIWSGVLSPLDIAIHQVIGPDVTTTNPGTLQSLVLNVATNLGVGSGARAQVLAAFQNVSNVNVTALSETAYQSSDPAVVAVDSTGGVTALSAGTTTLTATYGGLQASCLVQVVQPPAPVLSLRAWYPLEGSALDATGNGFNGSANNVTYTQGRIGLQAAQFNGSNSYVQIPRCVTDDFTIALWVKSTANNGGSGIWVNGLGLVDGEVGGVVNDFGISLLGSQAAFAVGNPDTTITSLSAVNDGQWHHIAATRNTTSGLMMLYVDGVIEAVTPGPTGPRTAPSSLRIGSINSGHNYFAGAIDEVQLYDRVLTATEITAMASALKICLPLGANWSYYDFGGEPPGTWRTAAYDDSAWHRGWAKFGYGGDGEVTTVSYGTNEAQKYITTNFRRILNVPDLAALTNSGPLEMRMICDDGAVVYLNGAEVFRYNMPAGPTGYDTLASSDILGADETRLIIFPVDPQRLAQGTNVIAVEVHQYSSTSGDLGFDLQLDVQSASAPGPRTLYVNDDSTAGDVFTSAPGNDNNTGLTPDSALRSLAAALAKYRPREGAVIYLDTGVYSESLTVPSGSKGFALIGAGMDRSIIDGGQTNNCLVMDHVVGITVRDLTLRHGKAVTPFIGLIRGGALLCTYSDLYMKNVALRDSAADCGGGAWVVFSDAMLDSVVFSGNTAASIAGGLFLDNTRGSGSRRVITNCVLTGNSAGDYAGGLYVNDGLVQGCTINNNRATNWGGGAVFRLLSGQSQIENCSITGNRANYSAGLDMTDGMTALNCTIANNAAGTDGGGVRSFGNSALSNCVFVGNSAGNAGGAGNLFDSASIRNCTLGGNCAVWGGGLTLQGNVTALDCVVTNNIATNDSGGLRIWDSAWASNCVIAGNSATSGGGVGVAGNSMLRDSVISNNTASAESGGVRAWDSASFSNCWIVANQAPSAGGLSIHHSARGQACVITNNTANDAGGLRLYDSAWLGGCTIAGNVATDWGGGAVMHHSTILENCSVYSNRATWGGGVDFANTAVARACVISNNTASTDGGGAYLWDSAALSNCTITANAALNWSGGGVYVNGNGLVLNCRVLDNAAPGWAGGGVCIVNGGEVRNSLLLGNAGNRGGGLYLDNGISENCTITSNTATNGGGLYIQNGAVSNTVIYFNHSPNGSNYFNNGSSYIYSHCCTEPDVPNGISIIVANPRFLNLASGDFALATNSPCLDAGINCSWMTNAFDLDGKPRLVNLIVDLGAYEAMPMWSDSDGDGLLDWWEWRYSHSLMGMAPGDDPDGDGLTNLEEYRLGHNPLVWDNLHFVACQRLLDGSMKLTVFGQAGSNYTLFASSNLTNWTPLFGFACTNATVDVFDPDARTLKSRFYRVGPLASAGGLELRLGSAQPLGSNGFDLVLISSPGVSCRIEASSDLLNWTTITNLLSTEVTTHFRDPAAVNYSQRFYRAVAP